MQDSVPVALNLGQWHVPYVDRLIVDGVISYSVGDQALTEKEALMISASCCAQVSYRKSDDTLEKAKMVFDRLINSKPVHASPVEHQATPMQSVLCNKTRLLEKGETHITKDGYVGSGNFYGWIQFRQLI